MNQYRIHNKASGTEFGVYEGETEEDALNNLVIDAGYSSRNEFKKSFGSSDDLIIEEI